MPLGLFITGTDTNVGKTVLSALLTVALDGVYWKPVQSGACEGTDRQAVIEMAEISEARALPERYCFAPPVSPHLAARETGVKIEMSAFKLPESPKGARLIVEGAGGVMTPLNETETILDLIRHLSLPAVVAARSTLGTINHTVLTLGALRAAGNEVLGVVMLGDENRENRLAIEHYGRTPVVGHVPSLATVNRRALLETFESNFDRRFFQPFQRAS